MSTSRPKLKLDEQSFQDMLAAAFTIQEHNARRRRALSPEPVCGTCGAAVKEGELLCAPCARQDSRPGEQLQRKWASLWLMTQEHGLSDPPAVVEPQTSNQAKSPDLSLFQSAVHIPAPADAPPEVLAEHEEPDVAFDGKVPATESEWPGHSLADLRPAVRQILSAPQDQDEDADLLETVADAPVAVPWTLRDLRLKLRFHRADLYLVVAIIVSTFAMIWVLSATPTSGAQRKPRLRPWERALVSLGLAEAPEPPPRRGNPNIQVWVDPKTALYYCVGEEEYGKTPGGRVATQRDAQFDQFEPAGRAVCE